MSGVEDFIVSKFEFLFGVVVAVFAWFLKLEFSRHDFKKELKETKEFARLVNRRVDSLQTQHDTLDSGLMREIKSIAESLAYIRGKLGLEK